MLFNTVDFAVFFPVVLACYWLLFSRNLKLQNLFLIAVSYLFYAFWDWRFLSLIFLSSLVDFLVGLKLSGTENPSERKRWLALSLLVNLGGLALFKYFNFFADSFYHAFSFFGFSFNLHTLKIILPVGISFYTFQTLSYTIDVYRRQLPATTDAISFFAFVSFFPQLVAGPIERASNLLPQFQKPRYCNYPMVVEGLRFVLLGLFKKMVIADNCALFVNDWFVYYPEYHGSTLFVGAVFFAFQIYGDFSGYSDIAMGTSKLLGFHLMQNFNMPYLSRNLGEFWRRWHISLSSWFRDYLYIPLGGNRGSKFQVIRNVFVVFLLSGLWHGANWTFIIWGLIHALFFIPLVIIGRNKRFLDTADSGKYLPSLQTFFQIGLTFAIVALAWVFFRAETVTHAVQYLSVIFSESIFSKPQIPYGFALFLFLYMVAEWLQRDKKYLLDIDWISSKYVRFGVYYCVLFAVFYFGGDTKPFIYFQF